jgi:hypothetical protein
MIKCNILVDITALKELEIEDGKDHWNPGVVIPEHVTAWYATSTDNLEEATSVLLTSGTGVIVDMSADDFEIAFAEYFGMKFDIEEDK